MITKVDTDTRSRMLARREGYAAGRLQGERAPNPYAGKDDKLAVPLSQAWEMGKDQALRERGP